MSEHTPAVVSSLPAFSGDGYSYGGEAVVTFGDLAIPFGGGHELAVRVAASWNACRGIETADLENGAVGGFAEQAGEMGGIAVRMEARADEAEALLTEARGVLDALNGVGILSGPDSEVAFDWGNLGLDAVRRARAFLASRP